MLNICLTGILQRKLPSTYLWFIVPNTAATMVSQICVVAAPSLGVAIWMVPYLSKPKDKDACWIHMQFSGLIAKSCSFLKNLGWLLKTYLFLYDHVQIWNTVIFSQLFSFGKDNTHICSGWHWHIQIKWNANSLFHAST